MEQNFKNEIQKAWFMSEIKTQILRVAFELSSDQNYSKEQAINDLVKIVDPIDVESQIQGGN
ncbi:hypothetical protein NSA56_01710 [Oceanobacillus caeni]|uniref:hypothetical protein n=1 Tax=Oceanobacillus caeni TaxID=405946 RepID=UPI00214A2985|nr:hypothetical protein [Oceanobacillus caeni]MCR1833112.1 hypothetical protein [Oceanobacillus caeni]